MRGGELTIQTRLHTAGGWVTFLVVVGGRRRIYVLLNSAATVSVISAAVRDELIGVGLLPAASQSGRHRSSALTIDLQPLPDVEARVSRGVARLGVDAMFGLDFLFHFEHVHFHVPTLRLVLSNPTNGRTQP